MAAMSDGAPEPGEELPEPDEPPSGVSLDPSRRRASRTSPHRPSPSWGWWRRRWSHWASTRHDRWPRRPARPPPPSGWRRSSPGPCEPGASAGEPGREPAILRTGASCPRTRRAIRRRTVRRLPEGPPRPGPGGPARCRPGGSGRPGRPWHRGVGGVRPGPVGGLGIRGAAGRGGRGGHLVPRCGVGPLDPVRIDRGAGRRRAARSEGNRRPGRWRGRGRVVAPAGSCLRRIVRSVRRRPGFAHVHLPSRSTGTKGVFDSSVKSHHLKGP